MNFQVIFVRKQNEVDLSAELATAWESFPPDESFEIGKANCHDVGLWKSESGNIERVVLTENGVRLVDQGKLAVPNIKDLQFRPPTEKLLNIPTQAIPVVLADFESLTG